MYYQILAPPTADPAKQADELGRLVKFCRQLTIQFVTVAGHYKPARARLTLLQAPDRLADPAARVLALLAGRDDAVKPSAPLRRRPEWRHHALLLPARPDALALDGTLLEGWDSACLTVVCRPGRVFALLAHCPEDDERVQRLRPAGWRVIAAPNPLQRLSAAGGRPWAGTPSLAPVPGGHAPAQVAGPALSALPNQAPTEALTNDPAGLALGITPTGAVLRLARRAQTLAITGRPDARRHALLALLHHAQASGMGVVVAVERTLLPIQALQELEARVRLLDVQQVADSTAIPWRAIEPALLAQALGGELAKPQAQHGGDALQSAADQPGTAFSQIPGPATRFGEVLDLAGAGALRVPGVLGLTAPPGDDLRGALAAGGLVVVPQDGDAASAVIARLLLAYLAAPAFSERALLLVLDPALVPPPPLRDCALQVVLGARSDAVLTLSEGVATWQLLDTAGNCVVELLPDLTSAPDAGAGPLVEAIVRGIGVEEHASLYQSTQALEWWDTEPIEQAAGDLPPLPVANELALADEDAEPAALHSTQHVHADGQNLDTLLEQLLHLLMQEPPEDLAARPIQELVARGEYDAAEQLASTWAKQAPAQVQPWLWRAVLAADDIDRARAARQAAQLGPAWPLEQLLRELLALLDLAEPEPPLSPQIIAPMPTLRPGAEQARLDDDALRAAWQTGATLPQLVARLVALGFDAPAARARIRAIVGGRAPTQGASMSATVMPFMPVSDLPAVGSRRSAVALGTADRQPPTAMPPISAGEPTLLHALPAHDDALGINGPAMAIMPNETLDDIIWRSWCTQQPTDALVQQLSGRRGGPKAEAARDRIYATVIPRIVAELGAADLATQLVRGVAAADDPRYPELLRRMARSELPPAGMLERAMLRRLIAVWAEC